jgi:prepilin-type N-terminal cleavage/methylation domain-containing protein
MRRPVGRAAGFTLVEILVVLAILAALMGLVAGGIVRAQRANRNLQCQNNLRTLGAILSERATMKGFSSRHGQGVLLETYVLGLVKEGDERVFLCPNDPAHADSHRAGFGDRYARIDLDRPAEGLCSYLVRDRKRHPWSLDSRRKEPIALCPHHGDGVMVLHDDGSVLFLDREALGLEAGAPIVIGPESGVEMLRMFPGR